MATEKEVMERAKQVLADQAVAGQDADVQPDTVLDEEGGVDSLGFIYVLTTLEAEFGSIVPQDEWWEIHTLSDLAHAIVAHQE